jgi:SH3-like domain-containing protein
MQKHVIFFILFLNLISNSFAVEKDYFMMLKNSKVNVRFGPGRDYPIKFVYKKSFLPVEVIDKKENFRKVIDHKKNSGWIHISQLKKSSSLIILSNRIIFKNPTKNSKPIINLESGRLLLVKKCIKNWCKVSTDKYSGWVQTKNVWGKVK